MNEPIITLTTDFGEQSHYVAQMKAAILAVNRHVRLIDVTHAIPAQDVARAAWVLANVAPWFPDGSLHLAVVDPGVGTSRPIVYARLGRQQYIGPDNGLFGLLARRHPPELVVAITNDDYWRRPVAPTFHGRDIMAPVAAHVAGGLDPRQLGSLRSQLATLEWPEPEVVAERISGQVLWADAFGNLMTNIPADAVERLASGAGRLSVSCRGASVGGLVRTYGERATGTVVALIGSSGWLELAVVGGDARRQLGAGPGEPVLVQREGEAT